MTQQQLSDETLMAQVKNGDTHQLSILFDRYHKHLYNFFVKISFDRELGHDLTQNVFMRVLKYSKSYRGGPVKPWLFQMARNVYADHFRKNKLMVADYSEVENIAHKLEAIDEAMVKSEKEKLLYLSLYKLNQEQREVLILTRFEQMKYEDVAQVLDCTVANVKVKVHRAIKQLRAKYMELEKI